MAILKPSSAVFGGFTDFRPEDFSSTLPTLDFLGFEQVDPAFLAGWESTKDGGRSVLRYVGYQQMLTSAQALRMQVGALMTSVGMLQVKIGGVRDVFREPLDTVANALDAVSGVLDSVAFRRGVDAIGLVPVVGVIVKVVVAAAKLVVKVLQIMEDKERAAMQRADALRSLIPMVGWSPEFDERQTQEVIRAVRDFNATMLCAPAYDIRGAADVSAFALSPEPGSKLVGAWLIQGNEAARGFGFVPGTRNIQRGLQLLTHTWSATMEIGDYMPTPSQLLSQWWQTVLVEGPALYSVDTRGSMSLETRWADYVQGYVGFMRDMMTGDKGSVGWTTNRHPAPGLPSGPAACFGRDTECVRYGDAVPAVEIRGDSTHFREGQPVHFESAMAHLDALFGWRHAASRGTGPMLDRIDYDRTIPVKAIRNLRERQDEALRSPLALTVDTSQVKISGEWRSRFPAIASNRRQWQAMVRAVFESGAFVDVKPEDVPGGPGDAAHALPDASVRLDTAVYQELVFRRGALAEPIGKMGPFGPEMALNLTAWAPGNPPPPPPPRGYIPLTRRQQRHTGAPSTASAAVWPLAAGAAAAALWAFRKR